MIQGGKEVKKVKGMGKVCSAQKGNCLSSESRSVGSCDGIPQTSLEEKKHKTFLPVHQGLKKDTFGISSIKSNGLMYRTRTAYQKERF